MYKTVEHVLHQIIFFLEQVVFLGIVFIKLYAQE